MLFFFILHLCFFLQIYVPPHLTQDAIDVACSSQHLKSAEGFKCSYQYMVLSVILGVFTNSRIIFLQAKARVII